MPSQQINITLGTAGHIDHGKTALIKCLTGCETDRLKAEKERGMSIDLGFAPCTIAGVEIGIVDVPGHENFIRTMVAGASGMDGVILVVAADDGVMPQTREHLDILTLLGVRHGLVVVTKIDRVEPDHLEAVRAELVDFLQGTFLEHAPILPVSNITGEGFTPFQEALVALADVIKPKQLDGVFRLPVDRAFSAKGYGTIVTGIPVSGSARIGDEVVLIPHGLSGRIRNIQVYGRDGDTVKAGQCAALNVPRWEHHAIQRGHTVATPDYFSPQPLYACTLRLLPRERLAPRTHGTLPLKSGVRVKLHTGTSEGTAAVYPMQGAHVRVGEEVLVQVKMETPVIAAPGDRFVLRALSPVQTIGGGTIIEALSRRLKRNRAGVLDDLRQRAEAVRDDKQFVEYCLRTADAMVADESRLSFRAKLTRDRLKAVLDELIQAGKVHGFSRDLYIHHDTAAAAGRRIVDILGDFHRTSPETPGLSLDQLQQASQFDKSVLKGPVLKGVVSLLKAQGRLVERSKRLALAEHLPTFQEEDIEHLEAIESLFRQSAFHPPVAEELVEKTGASADTVRRIVKILVENERLVQVAENLLFHQTAVDRARDILVSFIREEGELESVRFKYLLDTTRKFAIPLLDYFDRIGVTRRSGNTRYLKTPPS